MKNPLKDNIIFSSDTIKIRGALTQMTVVSLLKELSNHLPKNKDIEVDFSEITACDSASLAFLIAVLREARHKKSTLRFTHLPSQIHQLIKVSGLNFLPIVDE
jgi:phospholipid transport system transporter-binding protein